MKTCALIYSTLLRVLPLLVPARCPHVKYKELSRNVIMFSTLQVLDFYLTIERSHLTGVHRIIGGQNVEDGRPCHKRLQEPFNIIDHFRRKNHHFKSAGDIQLSSKFMRKKHSAIFIWTCYSCRTNHMLNTQEVFHYWIVTIFTFTLLVKV